MTISSTFVSILIGTAIVTFIPRTLPFVLVSKLKLPPFAIKFLTHVPLAVMTALVVQSIVTKEERWLLLHADLEWIALFPTLAVALLTRSLLWTVITGIGVMALLTWFM